MRDKAERVCVECESSYTGNREGIERGKDRRQRPATLSKRCDGSESFHCTLSMRVLNEVSNAGFCIVDTVRKRR
jgi:hypothetical protein